MQSTTREELITGIRQMDEHFGIENRKGLTKMRKADLATLHGQLLDKYLVATQPEIDQLRRDCAPSGDDHLSSADQHDDEQWVEPCCVSFVDGWHLETCSKFQASDVEIEQLHNEQSDAELIEFTREMAESLLETMPMTETNVIADSGKALLVLVQIGSKLAWGKLMAVVNRRTRYADPLLSTVEVNGVRRLVKAKDMLVTDTLVEA